jgi:hypothetical protein
MAILQLWSLLATYLFYCISLLCFRAGMRFSMSQDLFRQIGEKLESLFKKKLALFIVDKTHGESQPVNYFLGRRIFAILWKNVFKKEYSVINFVLWKTKKNPQKLPQFQQTIWKGVAVFYTFIFWISPNLAKYTCGLSPLEQHHKIDLKK